MNDHLGAERQSMIVGSSVPYQRGERFNTDLNVSVVNVFGPKLRQLKEVR